MTLSRTTALLRPPGGCFFCCLLFLSILGLGLLICGFTAFWVRSIVYATSSAGGHDSLCALIFPSSPQFVLVFRFLFLLFAVFHRICKSCLSYPV